MSGLSLVVSGALLLAACAASDRDPAANLIAAMVTRNYADPERLAWNGETARPLRTTIWYPTEEGPALEHVVFPPEEPIFEGGFAAMNAPLAQGDDPLPLVVLSHGTGGAGLQWMWLGTELAERGYVVAAVDHHGNTAAEPEYDPRGFLMPWVRATDLSAVIDAVIADPMFSSRVDRDKIGAVGFSLGGYTVTALAGGVSDRARFISFCESAERDATCASPSEYPEAVADFQALRQTDPAVNEQLAAHSASYRDRRVSSAVVLAPALAQMLTPDSLSEIEIPMLVVVGTADNVAPASTNAEYLAIHVPDLELHHLEGAGHYTFLDPCTDFGLAVVPVCRDAPEARRRDLHAETAALVADHFDRTLER